MPTLDVLCPHCSKPARLDTGRLPDGPATYPCPHCKQEVVVDKRDLLAAGPAAPEPSLELALPDLDSDDAIPLAVENRAPAAPPRGATAEPSPDRRFGRIPEAAVLPNGIVLGEDDATIVEVQQKLASFGSELERVDSAGAARELIVNQQPELCIFVGGNISAPPYAPMAPLTGLQPSFRRRLYLVLIADNIKTLDGMAAFLHQVNMVLNKQDLSHIVEALYSGHDYHNRLYKPFFQAAESRGLL